MRQLKVYGLSLAFVMLFGISSPGYSSEAPEEEPILSSSYYDEEDPLEPLNRAIFAFNQTVDKILLKPAAVIYRTIVPEICQKGIKNILANLNTPLVCINSLLQGQGQQGAESLTRFFVNTLYGVGGIVDVAGYMEMPVHQNDFDKTLAQWGIGGGPYLVLPIIGSACPRDLVGQTIDYTLDPYNRLAFHYEGKGDRQRLIWGRKGGEALVLRADHIDSLEALEADSLDFYSAIKSAYLQRSQAKMKRNQSL